MKNQTADEMASDYTSGAEYALEMLKQFPEDKRLWGIADVSITLGNFWLNIAERGNHGL